MLLSNFVCRKYCRLYTFHLPFSAKTSCNLTSFHVPAYLFFLPEVIPSSNLVASVLSFFVYSNEAFSRALIKDHLPFICIPSSRLEFLCSFFLESSLLIILLVFFWDRFVHQWLSPLRVTSPAFFPICLRSFSFPVAFHRSRTVYLLHRRSEYSSTLISSELSLPYLPILFELHLIRKMHFISALTFLEISIL